MADLLSIPAFRQRYDALLEQLPSRDIVLFLAILIYLRWADFQEAELEAIAAFDNTTYEPVLPASLHWRTWHHLRPDELFHVLTERLPAALHQLHNSRHNALATQLHRLASPVKIFSKLDPYSLAEFAHMLATLPFETLTDRRQLLDTFDDFFEASQDKYFGEFKTPRHIAKLMVELSAPSAGESVYDPCFGSAGLLTAANSYVLRTEEQTNARYGGASLTISGIEQNESAYIIGLTRLVLAGIDDPQIELGNSLERTPLNNPKQDGFDVVIANPPFGLRTNTASRDQFPVRSSDATGLFIQHALAQLRPGGRAVIVVPQGILFRGGQEKKLRQFLLEQHTVEMVVALPGTTFMPFAGVKSSILVLRRGGSTEQVRMVDAEPFFEEGKGRLPATISASMINSLVEKVHEPKPSDCCWDVDVATLTETDFDFTPRRRDKSDLSVILQSIRSEVELVKLWDCCQIRSGRSIRSADLVDEPTKVHSPQADQQSIFKETKAKRTQQRLFEPIPFIRIKDIKKGQINKGTLWIKEETAIGIGGNWKLRAGDVLLSKSGTIGKVGIVRNGAVGAIAASGLYVLRVDETRLDPHYLAGYLNSSDCRTWLKDRASGAVINHLTKRIIETIPVPLPPLQLQQRVVTDSRERGLDLLTYLTQLLTEGESDAIAEWVEKELKDLPTDAETISDPLNFTLLEQLATDAQALTKVTLANAGGALIAWTIPFYRAILSLRGVGNMPHGPGLFSILQESAQGLKRAETTIEGQLPSEVKARRLTLFVIKWLNQSIAALLSNLQLVFNTDTSTLRAGEIQELVLSIHNKSPLPLRELEIILNPEWGHDSLKYLAENSSEKIVLRSVAPKTAGQFALIVRWSALTLDGNQVEGQQEIGLEVLSEVLEEKSKLADIGSSPYVCGDPIRPERNDVFFGRENLLEQIRRQIVQSGNVVLLEGNRRAGKSSILRHLEGVGPVPSWIGVYCSLQGAEGSQEGPGVPTVAVFRELASSIAKGLVALGGETPLPNGSVLAIGKKIGIARACREGISEESPFADFRDYAETALEVVEEQELGILLMLDEFDKLQEGIDNGITSPQVPENIRFLVQTYPRFSAILTGSRRLKRLREEYWSALYGLGTLFDVTSLPQEAAQRLITEPVKGRLTYSREAVERTISLTNGQPYLLQCLCNRIFDLAAQLNTRSVNLDLADQAGDLLAENNEHFASLWDYVRSDRRRFILGLCHKKADDPDPLRFGFLLELLSSHGVEVSDETLIADIEFLRELELIELVGKSGSGHYTLSIPLMGRWIDRQHDFVVLKKKARMETEDHDD
ncbi:N-6 DNA methylase [Thermodesulfobacteriota bacterium]